MSSVMIKCVIDNMFSMFIVKILIVNSVTGFVLLKGINYVFMNNAISIPINCFGILPYSIRKYGNLS